MQEIITFLTKHWILSSIFAILLIAFIINEILANKGNMEISPQKAVDLVNHEEALMLDIRPMNVFQEGHIVGSLNIPKDTLDKKWTTLQKYLGKPVIVVCAMGQSARKVCQQFTEKGYQAFVLKDGIQGWKSAQLPLVKK